MVGVQDEDAVERALDDFVDLVVFARRGEPVSYTHLDVYKRQLEHRSLVPGGDRKVWGIFGDGEMDEPESIAALTLAAREKLDNLVFVVNCNLQRLDLSLIHI